MVDSFSKWVEVFDMNNNTSADNTINKLRIAFTSLGIPELIISDNGPQLVSKKFETFLEKNGIKHITTPTFYPATNGAAENSVKTFKNALKAAFYDAANKQVETDTIICRFLINYRSTLHCTTKVTPSKLFQGRELRTRLDFIRPANVSDRARADIARDTGKKRKRQFTVGDNVMVRDYRLVNKRSWAHAVIKNKWVK